MLPLEGIFIIHDWDPEEARESSSEDEVTTVPETPPTQGSDSSEEENQSNTHPPERQQHGDVSAEEELSTAARLPQHTIAFKVMGVTKLEGVQNLLLKMRELHDEGANLSIILSPEPDNPVDRDAIAFKCNLDGTFITLGYIARNLTGEVSAAMKDNLITEIKLKYIRYRFWQSGPGYYAAVNITRKGMWSSKVCMHASTF